MERNDQTDRKKVGPDAAYPMPRHIPGEPSGGASAGANLGEARGVGQVPQDESPKGISSQSGLNAYVGGQRKTLPSVPSPGQPGSRFNPVVISREEQAARRNGQVAPAKPAAKKSLDIGMPPGMIRGIPSAIQGADTGLDQANEPGVGKATVKGFAGGLVDGLQQNPQGDRQEQKDHQAPSEVPDPVITQPLIVDAVDVVQGKDSAPTRGKVVMNPAHEARLAQLENQQDDGLGRSGETYGR